MAAPATLVLAKILIPETHEPATRGTVKIEVEKTTVERRSMPPRAAPPTACGWP